MLDKSQLQSLPNTNNISPEEVARFDQLADAWWDPKGPYKNVLAFNQHRWAVILDRVKNHFKVSDESELTRLKVVDVGCGGGLLTEPFAQKGAQVTGIDASEMSIEVAKVHAEKMGLTIDYQHCLASELVAQEHKYDVVLNTEVIEHVPDQKQLIKECCQLLKPGGLLVLATLNRTLKSFLVGIVGAEYVLRMLPIGTHDWRYFVKPEELRQWLSKHQVKSLGTQGMAYNPFVKRWRNTSDLGVNYLLFGTHVLADASQYPR